MRIGIIGAGHIGGTVARLFVDAGHEVAVSNSRAPKTLTGLVEELGDGAQATNPAGAARFGEVVVVSVPFGRYRELPSEGVAGKVVIDTNNYYPQRDGHLPCLPWRRGRGRPVREPGPPSRPTRRADDGRSTPRPGRINLLRSRSRVT